MLRSVDTNVLVRLLLRDAPLQIARVDARVAGGKQAGGASPISIETLA